jgi:hypothetical protein
VAGPQNHRLAYRPLRGGIEIYNPRVDEIGSLGLAVRDSLGRPGVWLLSCYHVLIGGPNDLPNAADVVHQPSDGANTIATIDATRCEVGLDCATAKLNPGVMAVPQILGIGPFGAVKEPAVGDFVVKSGAMTGITEGIIDDVQGDTIIIKISNSFDANYDLSLPGDSGAVWLRRDDLSPVALHSGELNDLQRRVKASRLSSVLQTLNCQLL